MKTLPLLFFAITSIASAAVLTLTDGREFKDYRIVSQTPTTVLIRYANGAIKIEKKLLPADVLEKYPIDAVGAKDEAVENAKGKAQYDAQVKAAAEVRKKESDAWIAQRNRELGQEAQRAAEAEAERQRTLDQLAAQKARAKAIHDDTADERAASDDAKLMASIKEAATKKAKAYADHYYRYEFLGGISGAVVTRLDIDIEKPTPVTGWDNRFAVEGNCSLEYYESHAITFNKTVAGSFTVTVEWDGSQAKVVDFSKHYAPR